MADPLPRPRDEAGSAGDSTKDAKDLASLRAIIVPDLSSIAALRKRLDDPRARAEDIGAVLPQVLMQHAQDPNLTRALTPPLEKAITASVQRNPQPLADALFPVMGPAIRKAVASGLTGSVESLNRTIENSVSWRSMKWRVEAWRTGKSFAEVVLLKTMLYRVEQVFLIDRNTGLLLQHVKSEDAETQDADMVSGMLTAIRSFVQDSFGVHEHDSLEALKVGELSVLIEPGPHAIIAAVVRGQAPREYRRTLQDAVESIHLGFSNVLANFSGDASVLDGARPMLETCLQSQYQESERKPRQRRAWIVLGLITLALLVWAIFSIRDGRRWNRYIEQLRAQPGLVVVSTGRQGGRFHVTGMRDPLAPDPQTFIAASGLTADDVSSAWTPFQALEGPLVLERARTTLQPPAGVTLTLNQGVLSATGAVTSEWVRDVRRVAPLIAGVTRFDAAGALAPIVTPAIQTIESVTPLFPKGQSRLGDSQRESLQQVIAAAATLDSAAGAAGIRYRLDVTGHTDEDGAPELNLPLSRSRAEAARAAIAAQHFPNLELTATGVGSTQPVVVSQAEEDKQRNRRVSFKVSLLTAR